MTTSILTKLTKADGVTAACCGDPGVLSFSFDSAVLEDERAQFKKIFQTMVDLINLMPNEDELKITLNSQSLVLRRNQGTYVGVVAVKSHPVVKSLQRMVRSAFKKLGAPIRPSRPRPVPVPVAVPQALSVVPTRPLDVTPPAPPPKEDDDSGPPSAF
jgi:hypothetical protein